MLKMNRLILLLFLCAGISACAQKKSAADKDQQFIEFLENSLESGTVNVESRQMFNERSWAYWKEHMLERNQNPKKYEKALSLFYQNQSKFKQEVAIQIDRYEKAIENFRQFDNRNTLSKNAVLFIGSSSIRYWETSKSFPEFPVINRGFGGASLPEIIHYYDDIIKKHSPSVVVLYCDIDVESGKTPSVAVNAFKELVNRIEKDFPQTQILLLAMKPVLVDDFLGKDVRKNKMVTNKMLAKYCDEDKNLHFVDVAKMMVKPDGSLRSDIFLPDGMHMNPLGYTLWDPIIRSELNGMIK